jgi:hypothetical protein
MAPIFLYRSFHIAMDNTLSLLTKRQSKLGREHSHHNLGNYYYSLVFHSCSTQSLFFAVVFVQINAHVPR